MRVALLAFVLLFAAKLVSAQSFAVIDQNPASVRFYQLNTPHFRLLYPAGADSVAQQTARRLEQVYAPVSAGLGHQPRRLSVLLQNQTTVSNGFVTVSPRRSEFFTTAPQDPGLSGTNNWLDLLAVHEFRHVVQYDKFLQGYGKVVYAILGNNGLQIPRIGTPDWFMEGDAVGAETILTNSGRGRIPNFDLGFRANLLANRQFGYQKSVGGSYRDNVPNHYPLGYFLTTNLKRTNGADAWGAVLDDYMRRPPLPFSFSGALKKQTGLRVEDLYARTMTDLAETFRQQQSALIITPATSFFGQLADSQAANVGKEKPDKRPIFTNYQYPQYLTDSSVVVVKSGLGHISQLVILRKNGANKPKTENRSTEKRLFVQGFINDPDMLSAGDGKVVWIEYGFDPRWRTRIYSVIQVLDVASRKTTRLRLKGRFTAASLSPDNSLLVAVESQTNGSTQLVVLDAQTGGLVRALPNPENAFFQQPRWFADGRSVVVVALRNGQKTLRRINTQTNQSRDLLALANENISHPQPVGKYVLYNSPRSGIDNIYAVDTTSGQRFQVTSRPVGAYHAAVSPDGTQLAFQDFTADGFRAVEMPINPAKWTSAETVRDNSIRYFGKLISENAGPKPGLVLTDTLPKTDDYPAKRYSRLGHALNLYGWGPQVSSSGQTLTLGVQSQDILSTTQASIGYNYLQAENVGNLFAAVSYQGLYPIIDVNVARGQRKTSVYIDERLPLDSLRTSRWNYNQLSAGLRLPFNLTRSKYGQNLTISTYFNLLQVSDFTIPRLSLTEVGNSGMIQAMSYNLNYAALLKQSKRDVAPRFGLTLAASGRQTLPGGVLAGQLWAVQGGVFLPGIGRHHSLRLRGGYQSQPSIGATATANVYQFATTLFYPRGQTYLSQDNLRTASIEYKLPLFDTHFSVGRWLYLQRVKVAGFYDLATGSSERPVRDVYGRLRGFANVNQRQESVGGDVSFVFNVLRLRYPFEVGVRTIYLANTGQFVVQPLVIDIGF
jgi:hypothetical protein